MPYFGMTSFHSMTSTSYWSLFIMLPFQPKSLRTSTPYLVVHILDDKENWTIKRWWFTVQSLQASPMFQCTVHKPPRISLHSCGQAPGKLDQWMGGNSYIFKRLGHRRCSKLIPFCRGSEPKYSCQGNSWCQQLHITTCMQPCTLSPAACIHIAFESLEN